MRLRQLVLIVLLLVATRAAVAQNEADALEDALEQWLDDGGAQVAAEQLADLMASLRETPVNINDTDDLRLQEVGLVSPFQVAALRAYLRLYGRIASTAELYLVPGLDSATLSVVIPLVVAGPLPKPNSLNFKELVGHPKLHYLLGATATPNNSDPWHAYSRLRLDLGGHWQLQFSAYRDAGERWFSAENHYSGHLIASDLGPLRRAIVGRYNLQFGQGLALWTGFAPFASVGSTPLRIGQAVRGASAFAESGWLQGAAATFRVLRKGSVTGFYSHASGAQLAGANLAYTSGNLSVGLTAAFTHFDTTPSPRPYPYNYYTLRERDCQNVSLNATQVWRNALFFAEAAIDGNGSLAAVAGGRLMASSNTSAGVMLRHYSADYQAPYANAYGLGSSTSDEQGARFDIATTLPSRTEVAASADVARFPYLRYGAYSPTTGADMRLQLSQPIGPNTRFTARYRYRMKERNGVVEPQPNYQTGATYKRQVQADLTFAEGNWHTRTRVQFIWFSCQMHESLGSMLVAQDLRYAAQGVPLSFTARVALFDSEAYDAAIYMSESDLAYNFSTPMLLGQGVRCYIVASYAPTRNINLSAKYAATVKSDAPTAHTIKLQLRLAF